MIRKGIYGPKCETGPSDVAMCLGMMTNDLEYIEGTVQNWINAAKRNPYSATQRKLTDDNSCLFIKELAERTGIELSARQEFEDCIYSDSSEKWELLFRRVLPQIRGEVLAACQRTLRALPCPMWSDVLPETFAAEVLSLFHVGQYLSAIRKGCDVLRATIRAKTGLHHLDGSDLINQAFGKDRPFVFAVWEGHSEDDVQRGYTDMLRGAMTGVRNPYYHGTEEPTEKEAARLLLILGTLWERADTTIVKAATISGGA
jgi:uncharacterized protein (TIGR02391 family)